MNAAPVAAAGRIGPNAVTRVAQALESRLGDQALQAVFGRAGLTAYLQAPPQHMVDEREVRRLHLCLRELLPRVDAEWVARDAGRRTADYLLTHRIPRPVQGLLKLLPAWLAARVLLRAIAGHAWTFCGSGDFRAAQGAGGLRGRDRALVEIRHNPLCRGVVVPYPVCGFYAATFERLFRVLVHPATRVQELSCEAMGADACRFAFTWG